ncbi:MAG TPA: glycosyltransferase family 9 protein [Candidatus Limnocylindrales bacterium]|nr:glycosyltransferase family 9 protein [Candidatus Limnocylindrales bacterium]
MDEERFLILRMGALGDIIHTLPAVAALRETFPRAEIHWLADRKWLPILDGNPDVTSVMAIDRNDWRSVMASVRQLRAAHCTTALDFQSLYRSAILARLSGAPRRIGFDARYAREAGAAFFYTSTVMPQRAHKVEHNLELVESIGARPAEIRFPLQIAPDAQARVDQILTESTVKEFFVVSPGGGWGSKCWPAERYGALCRALTERYGWRAVISFGPGERGLAETVQREAGSPQPLVELFTLAQLMALLRRAKLLVAGDTGPLHLASALGTPVVGLYGPTDPARNGPFSHRDIVVRNASPEETTYRREKAPAASMLSITVEQALDAVARRLRTN